MADWNNNLPPEEYNQHNILIILTNGDLSLLFRYGLCTSYLDWITKNIRNEETNNENDAEAKLEDEIRNLRMDETKV